MDQVTNSFGKQALYLGEVLMEQWKVPSQNGTDLRAISDKIPL